MRLFKIAIPESYILFGAIRTEGIYGPSENIETNEDLLGAMVNKTIVTVRVQNPTVTGASVGTVYYHQFSGYITDLTMNQSTTEFINFSGTIQSSGTLDVIA